MKNNDVAIKKLAVKFKQVYYSGIYTTVFTLGATKFLVVNTGKHH